MAREKPNYDFPLDERFTHEELQVEDFFERRFHALMEHYDIDYDKKKLNSRQSWLSWRELALALAHDHVPGCQIKIKPGRKSERSIEDLVILTTLTVAKLEGRIILKHRADEKLLRRILSRQS